MPIYEKGDKVYVDWLDGTFVVKNVIHLGNGMFAYIMENCCVLFYENQLSFA